MRLRLATAADTPAIARFCREIDREDYVPSRLEPMMAGGTFVLLEDRGRIVGLDRFERKPDGSVWFSAARIHPDYRGRGWINRMNAWALARPELRGVNYARMLITTTNTSSLRAAEKGGYRVATRLAILEWGPRRKSKRGSKGPSGFEPVSARAFAAAARRSRILKLQGGLLYFPAEALAMTEVMAMNARSLARGEERGMLHGARPWGPLIAAFPRLHDKRWLQMQPFATTEQGARAVLGFLREAKARGGQLTLPDDERITERYIAAGFTYAEWGRHVLIFQKRIARRHRVTSRARRRAVK
jgi:N-acetylglutamate synthase-like GNAT family acetyltransferase